MYNVSNEYKAAISAANIKSDLVCDIDGDEYGAEYILSGAFKITNQCSGTQDITLGAVYVGELTATFIIPETIINRTSWDKRQITPVYKLWTGNEWESLPLGIYTVSQATYTDKGVKVVAYDNMIKFDRRCTTSQSGGYPYDLLNLACSACGVTLGMTRAEVEALPNGAREFLYTADNDVSTWRDFIHYVAVLMCGFATINRAGELEIRRFGTTAVDNIGTSRRDYSASFSDYTTAYTGVTLTNIETQEFRLFGTDTGSVIDLGSNPFLQTGINVTGACEDLVTAVELMQYTPFKASVAGNPAYDLGDALTYTGGRSGTTSTGCLMKYDFQNHVKFTMQGYGSNPALAKAVNERTAKESNTKATVSALLKKATALEQEGLIILKPTLIFDTPIDDHGISTVLVWLFKSTGIDDTFAIMATMINAVITTAYEEEMEIYTDCEIKSIVKLDDNVVASWTQTCGDEKGLLTADLLIEEIQKGNHELSLTLQLDNGEIA